MRFDLFALVLISLQVLSQEQAAAACENTTVLEAIPIPLKGECNQRTVDQGRVCCFVTYIVGTTRQYECANLLNELKYIESYEDLKDTEANDEVEVICNSNTLISSFALIMALILF